MQLFFRGTPAWQYRLYASMLGQPVASPWVTLSQPPRWIASQFYGFLAAAHRAAYAWGIRPTYRLPCYVVSIGNLTLGGTGKTPLTLWLARWYQQQGWRVAIVSRGYKARAAYLLVSHGTGPLVPWQEAGDEPYLLAQSLPGVTVLIGRRRVLSAYEAWKHWGAEVVLLDDGFQHYALQRDLDLVLVDASQPFGQGGLLPAGILREPLRALRRAAAVILTRVEMAPETLPDLQRRLRVWLPEQPIFQLKTLNTALYRASTGAAVTPGWLRHRRIVAFAGLGNPQAFVHTLSRSGATILAFFIFPDHHPYTLADWQDILREAQRCQAEAVITTEKDAVRLAPEWHASSPLLTLRLGMQFMPAQPSFEDFLHTHVARFRHD